MGLGVADLGAVGAQGLEQAVAREETGVGRVDPHLRVRMQSAVPPDHGSSLPPSAARKARALASLSASSSSGSESATMPQPAW